MSLGNQILADSPLGQDHVLLFREHLALVEVQNCSLAIAVAEAIAKVITVAIAVAVATAKVIMVAIAIAVTVADF